MTELPRAAVLLVGDELLAGHRRDEIGPRLAGWLEALGLGLTSIQIVSDEPALIAGALRALLESGAELTIVCGGLGPTRDDRTRESVAAALGVDLVTDEDALARLEQRYARRGREMPEEARRQARLPAGSERIPNPVGTAPGFVARMGRTIIAALPGVPREFDEMFRRHVIPLIAERRPGSLSSASSVLRLVGVSEAEIHRKVVEAIPESPDVKIKYLAHEGELELIVVAHAETLQDAEQERDAVLEQLRRLLGDVIYAGDGTTLVALIRDLLATRGWTLATAESCTGGLVGKLITDLPGASEFFLGGVVAYSDREKQAMLGVPAELLENFGAVSPAVARAMAEGCRKSAGSSLALSVTGIAGPAGGSDEKPVGLIYLGLSSPEGSRVFRHTMQGDRSDVRQRSAVAALDEARRALQGLPPLGVEIEPEAS